MTQQRMVGLNAAGRRVGETHPRATLSDHDVELMFKLHATGMGYRAIGRKFDRSWHTVRNILARGRRSQTVARYRPA